MIFWDTSALIRCYEGSEASHARAKKFLLTETHHFASVLIRIEAYSGIRRRYVRDKVLLSTLTDILGRHLRHFNLSPVDERVLETGELLVERHALRAGDALHLSAAVLLARDLGRRQFRFVTSDAEQADAAKAENLKVILLA